MNKAFGLGYLALLPEFPLALQLWDKCCLLPVPQVLPYCRAREEKERQVLKSPPGYTRVNSEQGAEGMARLTAASLGRTVLCGECTGGHIADP